MLISANASIHLNCPACISYTAQTGVRPEHICIGTVCVSPVHESQVFCSRTKQHTAPYARFCRTRGPAAVFAERLNRCDRRHCTGSSTRLQVSNMPGRVAGAYRRICEQLGTVSFGGTAPRGSLYSLQIVPNHILIRQSAGCQVVHSWRGWFRHRGHLQRCLDLAAAPTHPPL